MGLVLLGFGEGSHLAGGYAVESQDLSEDIIVFWKTGVASIDIFHPCSQQVIIIIIEINSFTWILSDVYSSTEYRERYILWQEVSTLIA